MSKISRVSYSATLGLTERFSLFPSTFDCRIGRYTSTYDTVSQLDLTKALRYELFHSQLKRQETLMTPHNLVIY